LLPGLQDAFDRIEDSAKRVRPGHDERVLTVTVQPSFAGAWLISRLPRFAERHPDIDVKLSATHDRVDLMRGDFDVGVRFGPGSWPGDLRVDRLMDEDLFPVCSPALLERGPPLERPEDLRLHTLLHDDHVVDWRMWLLAAGVSGIDTARGPMLNFSDLVLQSAAAGHGVALARSVLAARYLASGELVRPFEFSLPGKYAYYVVSAAAKANQPKVRKFREWILEVSHEDAAHEAALVDTLRADAARQPDGG
jgi:LysR family glycine cleavage system transcriptional activator